MTIRLDYVAHSIPLLGFTYWSALRKDKTVKKHAMVEHINEIKYRYQKLNILEFENIFICYVSLSSNSCSSLLR